MGEIMGIISEKMAELGIEYAYERFSGTPSYPYWVGEYVETEPVDEDGMTEASFTLTGTTRGTLLELEQCRAKIEAAFDPFGGLTTITDAGNGIAIYYAGSLTVPTDTDEIRRLQVSLSVKKWRAYNG